MSTKLPKKCSADACLNQASKKGLCPRHYQQVLRHGFVQKRTKTTPNEFVFEGNICKIYLYNHQSEKISEAIIDQEDAEKCRGYKWCGSKQSHATYVVNSHGTRLTNFILGVITNYKIVIDHKDGDPFNNRKDNLQIISIQYNNIKKRAQSNNTSGYRGVYWNKRDERWEAEIMFNRKKFCLGHSLSKREAAKMYNDKAVELFGNFAILNKIGKDETNECFI